jgi:hypothetical protein
MIKFEKESKTKLVGKGILKRITETGIEIEDTKTGELEIITFDMLASMVESEVSISFVSKDAE